MPPDFAIDAGLLDILCCPSDRGELIRNDAGGGSPVLECVKCNRVYPIRNGIPRFVADDQYAGNFSHEWTVHRTTQLDAARQDGLSESTFMQKTGWKPEDVRGRLVLDVGCGMGRFADVVVRWGGRVVGVDLSFAVDSAQANLGATGAFQAIQASVFDLPFRADSFDLIYSLGVLHHTPDTRRAFFALPPLLRHSGQIAIWVYSLHSYPADGMEERRDRMLRRLTTRMPLRVLYALCRMACLVRMPWRPFWHLLLPGFVFHAFPRTHGYSEYRERVLDTFDWYSPTFQFKHSYPEVCAWFRESGLSDIVPLDIDVAVRGRKPAARPATQQSPLQCAESSV